MTKISGCLGSLEGPLLWSTDLSDAPLQYTLVLEQKHRDEIREALNSVKARGIGLHDIRQSNFELPSLGKDLVKFSEKLYEGKAGKGKGFFTITGFDVDHLRGEDWDRVYLGISSYIVNEIGVQNENGDVFAHVTAPKDWTTPENQRHGIHTTQSLPFHTNMGCDILSYQARECAKKGGTTYLASASTIYEKLCHSEYRDALSTALQSTWPIQTSPSGDYVLAPLMKFHQGNFLFSADPSRLGPQTDLGKLNVPELTEKQRFALSVIEDTARENEVGVTLQKGDMLFINNWAILHRRAAYLDSATNARHLVKMWSRNTWLSWNIPQEVDTLWTGAYKRKIGGQKVYNTEPPAEHEVHPQILSSATSVTEK